MAARFNLGQFLTGVMGQHPARVSAFLESLDDATAARLMAAAEAGDNRTVLKAMADQTWGMSKPKATPAPEPTGSRSPMPFEDRVSRDPNIRATINEAGIPPALRAGVEAGDPNAIMEAYRGAVSRGGSTEDAIRALAKPADQVAAEGIAGQFDRAVRPGADVSTRQMELPISAGEREAYQRLADGRSVVRRGEVPEDVYADMVTQDLARQPFVRPYSAPDDEMRVAADMTFDEVPPRPAKPRPAAPRERVGMSGRDLATAAGVGLAMGGATDLALNAIDSEGSSPEDLVEESRPAPVVEATASRPEPTVVQAPRDYSLQARALINRLNDMRRAAGGEVPEAPAMMAEINRLVAMGNQQRRDPGYSYQQADPARDPYQQARELIAQVNQMYQRGMTPNSPEVQRIMARVRQLQAQGDAIRNRRAG